MGGLKKIVAAAVLALGLVAGMVPAASATTCDAVLGDEACAQLNDTLAFVKDTAGSPGPIVEEQRDRVATIAGSVYGTAKGAADQAVALVLCVVSGDCI